MPLNSADIDDIVRRVMARLDRGPAVSGSVAEKPKSGCGCGCNGKGGKGACRSGRPDARQLTSAVVCQEEIDRLPSDIKAIAVAPRAVVTPAARDRLRERGIQMTRGDAPTSEVATEVSNKPNKKLYVAATGGRCPDAISAAIGRRGIVVERIARGESPDGTIDRVAASVAAENVPAVVLTDAPERAACRANRREGVFAVATVEIDVMRRARETMAANLLAVDPQRTTRFTLERLVDVLMDHASDVRTATISRPAIALMNC